MMAALVASLGHAASIGATDLYAEQAAQWLAAHLLATTGALPDPEGRELHPGHLTDARLARALDYVSAHFAEPITLDALAAEAAISKFHFATLFRRKLGLTPHGHVTRVRMEAARRLLLTTDLPVGEIAVRCGYGHHSSFSKAFSAQFGMSPKALRGMS